MNQNLEKYKILKLQWESIVKTQKTQLIEINDLVRTIDNDVKRTDRNLPQFKDENTNLKLLKNVLMCFSIYDKDSGYVQGMGDLLVPIIVLYIKDWEDNEHPILFDKGIVTREETEAFCFSMLCGIMSTIQQNRMFTELSQHQQFIMERSLAIATFYHRSLKKWLHSNELNNLIFLYRPILLLFKREFKISIVMRIWDSFFSHEIPYSFPRIYLSSLLIHLFPYYLFQTNGNLGDVMSLTDSVMPTLNGVEILNLAINLEEKLRATDKDVQWVFEKLPEKAENRKAQPKYMKLK